MARKLLLVCALLLTTALSSIRVVRSAEPEPLAHGAARAIVATGIWVNVGEVPSGFDPAFAKALRGWNVVKGGSAAACHLVVRPWGKFVVAIGFFDPQSKPGVRLQDVVIDGRKVDTLDPAGPRPFVRFYEVADVNGDGYLQVSCSHAKDESGATGQVNIVWLFEVERKGQIDAEKLARGNSSVPLLCRVDAASADRAPTRARELPQACGNTPAADAAAAARGPWRRGPGPNRSIRCISRFAGSCGTASARFWTGGDMPAAIKSASGAS